MNPFDHIPDAMKLYLMERVFEDLSRMKGFIKMRKEDPRQVSDQELKRKILRSIEGKFNFNIKEKEKDNTMATPTPAQSINDAKEQEMAKKLAELSIVREGTKLIVPEGIDYDTAMRALSLKRDEEEQEVSINHIVNVEVAEGMVAFLRVLEAKFGFVSNTGHMGFWGKEPPEYLGIETSPGHRESIPIGRLRIPGIAGYLTPTFGVQRNYATFKVEGECKGKDRHKVDEIVALVEAECRRNSIYRGHAITTSFPNVKNCSCLEDTFPQFAKLEEMRPEQVIFSREIEEQVTISLFVPIIHAEACRRHKIPLKRGILLEGPYGTGKTLTASATATVCKEHGWTFIYLKDVMRLADAYTFAAKYQPAVIFAEDLDQVIMGDDEDAVNKKVKEIQNAMDGIETKGIEVITVLTTNHVERITLAMLRPGRLDTVVSVRAPDAEAALRLVKMYAGDLLDPSCDFNQSNVGDSLAGQIPALIREVVERSKLAALRRSGDQLLLTPNDIEVTALSMKNHMNLLKNPEPDERSTEELAAATIANGLIRSAEIRAQASSETHSFVGDNHKGIAATG